MTRPAVPRIVATGSECTGKTTLSHDLAERLGARWVPEFARLHAESVGRPLGGGDVEPIARGQISREDVALGERPALLVMDTDLVSTVVYSRFYYGTCPEWIVDAARRRLGHLYLLCDIDVPWVPDGVRDQPHARAQIHGRFREALREFGAQTVTVSGLGWDRLTSALEAVEAAGLLTTR